MFTELMPIGSGGGTEKVIGDLGGVPVTSGHYYSGAYLHIDARGYNNLVFDSITGVGSYTLQYACVRSTDGLNNSGAFWNTTSLINTETTIDISSYDDIYLVMFYDTYNTSTQIKWNNIRLTQ